MAALIAHCQRQILAPTAASATMRWSAQYVGLGTTPPTTIVRSLVVKTAMSAALTAVAQRLESGRETARKSGTFSEEKGPYRGIAGPMVRTSSRETLATLGHHGGRCAAGDDSRSAKRKLEGIGGGCC